MKISFDADDTSVVLDLVLDLDQENNILAHT